jgi:small-conductance mechanosensitive channel
MEKRYITYRECASSLGIPVEKTGHRSKVNRWENGLAIALSFLLGLFLIVKGNLTTRVLTLHMGSAALFLVVAGLLLPSLALLCSWSSHLPLVRRQSRFFRFLDRLSAVASRYKGLRALPRLLGSIGRLLGGLGNELRENPLITFSLELAAVAFTVYISWFLPSRTSLGNEFALMTERLIVFVVILSTFVFMALLLNGYKRTTFRRITAESLAASGFKPTEENGGPVHRANVIPVLLFILPPTFAGLGILIAVEYLGYDVSSTVLASGIIGLILGFALQDPLSNIFEGLLLQYGEEKNRLTEGDMIQMPDGRVCRIDHMGMRSTRLLSIYEECTIRVPNSALAQDTLVLLDKPGTDLRATLPIGVAYGSDLGLTQLVVQRIAAADEHTVMTRKGGEEIANAERSLQERLMAACPHAGNVEGEERWRKNVTNFLDSTRIKVGHQLDKLADVQDASSDFKNPEVFFDSFGGSAIGLTLAFYVDDVRGEDGLRVKKTTTRIALAISDWLTKLNIEFPFPAMDLRFRDPWLAQHFSLTGIPNRSGESTAQGKP